MHRLLLIIMTFTTFETLADNDRYFNYLDIGYSYSDSVIDGVINMKGDGLFIEKSFQPSDNFFFGAFIDRKEFDIEFQNIVLAKNRTVGKYGLFTGYQMNINQTLNWYGMMRLFRFDSGSIGFDQN